MLNALIKRVPALLVAAVVFSMVVWSGQAAAPAHAAAPTKKPIVAAALSNTRIEFGLGNFDPTWMTQSGVPWKYRYQYLSGGVNTGGGWETWNSPTGQFAVNYMSNTGSYVPVFTYYEMLQSSPSSGSDEPTRDYNNLNNTSTMNAYYGNFKLLMQKAGAYGQQVIVHVEPDFWGYMQQRAGGNSASSVAASVNSSGFPEAASFANNLVGFSSELKYLRDTYAPNVVLAAHASMWSSGIDLASNTDPTINAQAEADKTAAFLNSAGSWDAIFNDVDDHDAAWWELASCGSPPCVNQFYTRWWDTHNVNFPNFTRYLAWVAELHAQTGKPQVVWQVPMGNQYFLTENNTNGHYQDVIAPYFIAHANNLFQAGLVAVLFGAGNANQTNYDDTMGDGVTNNSGVPTTDALGGCIACNTAVSAYPDDDGGFLRIFVGAYYKACGSAFMSPSMTSPQASGASLTFTATSTGCSSPEYRFFLQAPGGAWRSQPAYGGPTWTWNTAGYASGVYGVGVWVRQSGSPASYEAYWLGTFTLGVSTCNSAALSTVTSSPQAPGTDITFNAGATHCAGAQFRFWLQSHGSWSMQQEFGVGSSWNWHTTGLTPGLYEIGVWARQPGSTSSYDAYGFYTFVLGAGACAATLSPSVATPQAPGATVTLNVSSTGCASPLYEFWMLPPGGTWGVKQAYGSTASWSWNTTGYPVGTYQIGVWAKASASGNSYDTYFIGTYQLDVGTCTAATLSAAPASPQVSGTPVTLTATATGCGAATFEFWELPPPGSTWSDVQPYSGTNTFAWNTTNASGPYRFGVWVRQSGSTASYDSYAIVTFWIN